MNTMINLTRRRYDGVTYTDQFITPHGGDDPEAMLRNAVRATLDTPRGEQWIDDTENDFNWGDALEYMTRDDWKAHGTEPMEPGTAYVITDVVDIHVEQDEILC